MAAECCSSSCACVCPYKRLSSTMYKGCVGYACFNRASMCTTKPSSMHLQPHDHVHGLLPVLLLFCCVLLLSIHKAMVPGNHQWAMTMVEFAIATSCSLPPYCIITLQGIKPDGQDTQKPAGCLHVTCQHSMPHATLLLAGGYCMSWVMLNQAKLQVACCILC